MATEDDELGEKLWPIAGEQNLGDVEVWCFPWELADVISSEKGVKALYDHERFRQAFLHHHAMNSECPDCGTPIGLHEVLCD